jgi:cobalamin biosynthesis Co2+ chelatase CbiK
MGLFVSILTATQAKNALVIIVHGSPSPQWNELAMNIETGVRNTLESRHITNFDYVKVAMMEFAKPNISTVIKDCEKRGTTHIFAIPLFIAPSSHSEEDIPNILGLKYNPQVIKRLNTEGTQLVHTKIPVTVGPTLYYCTAISDIITDRVKSLSTGSTNESLVLVAHGDPEYQTCWDSLMKETGKVVSERTGIKFSGFTFVEMGQHFYKYLYPVLQTASKDSKHIIVQGIYLSEGIKQIAEYAEKNDSNKEKHVLPDSVKVDYSPYGLLPDTKNHIADWIVATAEEWTKSFR